MQEWRRFCVVGPGNHALTKLVPAIAANGQELVGVVSRRAGFELSGCPVFTNLDDALDALPADSAFLISSPPEAHFAQACAVLARGRDVIIEKPAFVAAADARHAADLSRLHGGLLAEAFMHRHTGFYRRFLADWRQRRPQVQAIEIEFCLPALSPGTFRDQRGSASSLLLDIGCYAVSLLGDLDLGDSGLELVGAEGLESPITERYLLTGCSTGLQVCARLGNWGQYRNSVTLRSPDRKIVYEPFFYGRPGIRKVTEQAGERETSAERWEADAFQAMLATPLGEWRRSQDERLRQSVLAAGQLEKLAVELQRRRAEASGSC